MPLDLMPSVTVCEHLSIDRSTLSRWVTTGRITPAHKNPGATGAMLFDPADVRRLADELEVPADLVPASSDGDADG